jgi:hypothetical protein
LTSWNVGTQHGVPGNLPKLQVIVWGRWHGVRWHRWTGAYALIFSGSLMLGWVELRFWRQGKPMTLFDLPGGREDRDDGMRRANEHASDAFKLAAMSAIVTVARQTPLFIMDEVWKAMGTDAPKTHDNRVLGPLMRQAQRDGLCEPIDQWRQTAIRTHHASHKRVWRSKVCVRG